MSPAVAVALIGLISAVLTGAIGTWQGWRKGQADGEKAAREADSEAQRFYAGTIEAQNERLDAIQNKLLQGDERHLAMQAEVLKVRLELVTERDWRSRLEYELQRVYDWIERGAEPPPLKRPSWFQAPLDFLKGESSDPAEASGR